MRLRKIHLAGFKSFIDPTTIEFPSELIGIVGPNGCGKSNVIDAVRWVMGESSAKHLRGDMMADVIFNGSATRKPVGQASVELIFDNAEGRLGDKFSSYSEISVRRQVNRDGQSIYMLNGSRCRRRDITDVFLGTGLGPRSYAIIEQGTISRLVEARPEELREFLEEAAGISRYKERRRETENRIRHTEENLDRLNDLREELDSQLERLRRQAAQAERYKTYKAEERRLALEVLVLRWSGLDAQVTERGQNVAQHENTVESALAEQRRVEAELESQRQSQSDATQAFNERYREVLEAGAEVGRAEEAIARLRNERDTLTETLADERASLASAERNAAEDAERLASLRSSLASEQPELERAEDLTAQAREGYARAEAAMLDFQREWERIHRSLEEPTRTAHAERTRIESLSESRVALEERNERLSEERAELEAPELAERLDTCQRRYREVEAERDAAQGTLAAIEAMITELRADEAAVSGRLDEKRQDVQALLGKQASLEALQQAALNDGQESIRDWLETAGLGACRRLAEILRVAPGWEAAVEAVLSSRLQSLKVDALDDLADALTELRSGPLALLETPLQPTTARSKPGLRPLLDVFEEGASLVASVLDGIYTADSLDAAWALRSKLAADESVVTPSGIWLGPHWLLLWAADDAESGVLAREQALRELREAVTTAVAERDVLAAALEQAREGLASKERERREAQSRLAAFQDQYAELASEVSGLEAELESRAQRMRDVVAELTDLAARIESVSAQRGQAEERLHAAEVQCGRLESERSALEGARERLEQGLSEARERWQALRQGAYERELALESTRSQIVALEEASARMSAQVQTLQTRTRRFEVDLAGMEVPLAEAQAQRQNQLERHTSLEGELRTARETVESGEEAVRGLEQSRLEKESVVERTREALSEARMQAQETQVRRQTVAEQLEEQDADLQTILSELSEDAEEQAWSAKLSELERRIARMGAINLAAIDEFESQSERKAYLDAQHDDLTEALRTLEEAMRKIDQDTRTRFKDTYERVNAGLEEKFPRLFGGGNAYLQLTGDDLLTTGVVVMARPPGKRNSSIHLLSGGEKALTAVALVFAIFNLNPAPFCLLDEVDAPLDDANVGRFSELVREMSEQVQVLLVTHNKVTMEAANQLVGVTMNEPGVSRLVAVDLDAAVEMAAD